MRRFWFDPRLFVVGLTHNLGRVFVVAFLGLIVGLLVAAFVASDGDIIDVQQMLMEHQ